jgi:aconitate hydratase
VVVEKNGPITERFFDKHYRIVIIKSFARIHWQNLIDFDILPLTFSLPEDWRDIDQGDDLIIEDVRKAIQTGNELKVFNPSKNQEYRVSHSLAERQMEMVLAGSLITVVHSQSD